jgi:hypothetical protein
MEKNLSKEIEHVRGDIEAIENKLYESGRLISATGDREASASISYGDWDCGGEVGPHWIISIFSENYCGSSDDKFEEISDFVNEKISDASEQWPENVLEKFSDCWGQIVTLNGRQVY